MKKFSFVVLSVLVVSGFLLSTSPARASVMDDLMIAIKSLKKDVGDIKSQLGAASALSVNTSSLSSRDSGTTTDTISYYLQLIANGDSSMDTVENLQSSLNDRGYNAGIADGDYGPLTQSAVQRYQLANNTVTIQEADSSEIVKDQTLQALRKGSETLSRRSCKMQFNSKNNTWTFTFNNGKRTFKISFIEGAAGGDAAFSLCLDYNE